MTTPDFIVPSAQGDPAPPPTPEELSQADNIIEAARRDPRVLAQLSHIAGLTRDLSLAPEIMNREFARLDSLVESTNESNQVEDPKPVPVAPILGRSPVGFRTVSVSGRKISTPAQYDAFGKPLARPQAPLKSVSVPSPSSIKKLLGF
jgi:hypothetical protein